MLLKLKSDAERMTNIICLRYIIFTDLKSDAVD